MTMDRERIAREVAEEFKGSAQGFQLCPPVIWYALIDARCRIAELEAALARLTEHAVTTAIDAERLALREKEPKV